MEKTTLIAALVICAVLLPRGNAVRSRESALVRQLQSSAELQQNKSYYYSTSSGDVLGWPNPDAAAGNPLKGLFGSTDFTNFDWNATSVDASLEYCYIGLDELMKGDPDVVGSSMAFNWTMLETRLQGAASRNRHIVLSVVAHYPNWNNVSVPKYLLDAGLQLYWYPDFLGGGYSPDYGDPMLLKALEQYIKAFGARYDGDPRIGFVNLGLLGFWVRSFKLSMTHAFAQQNKPASLSSSCICLAATTLTLDSPCDF